MEKSVPLFYFKNMTQKERLDDFAGKALQGILSSPKMLEYVIDKSGLKLQDFDDYDCYRGTAVANFCYQMAHWLNEEANQPINNPKG
jgi:hypothetical protein